MEWGPDGGFGPVPETKIMKKKLDMVDHPMVDWGIYPKDSDTSLWDYKIASWAVDRIGRLEKERANQPFFLAVGFRRSEEHTSELQSLMRISYAVFCLQNNITNTLNS